MSLTANINVKISPQGYQINDSPENVNPFWDTEAPAGVYVKTLTINADGDNYTLSAGYSDGTSEDIGTWTAGGEDSSALASIGLTSENGIYTLTATTRGGSTSTVGTIEVPSVDVDNLIAEVNDAIVENITGGYDFHTITETENNGTKNNVGSFYIARNQITGISVSDGALNIEKVNQSGETSTEAITLPTGSGGGNRWEGTYGTSDLALPAINNDSEMIPSTHAIAFLHAIPAPVAGGSSRGFMEMHFSTSYFFNVNIKELLDEETGEVDEYQSTESIGPNINWSVTFPVTVTYDSTGAIDSVVIEALNYSAQSSYVITDYATFVISPGVSFQPTTGETAPIIQNGAFVADALQAVMYYSITAFIPETAPDGSATPTDGNPVKWTTGDLLTASTGTNNISITRIDSVIM